MSVCLSVCRHEVGSWQNGWIHPRYVQTDSQTHTQTDHVATSLAIDRIYMLAMHIRCGLIINEIVFKISSSSIDTVNLNSVENI